MLRVVDISDAQAGIDIASLDCDAVIIKVTGGDYYTNPYWREHAEATISSGKLLGLYHYAKDLNGGYSTPEIEAGRFLDEIGGYVGMCVVALDWEREADPYPISWASEWCNIVGNATGATPLLYAGASDINSRDFSPVSGYPLWMSSYLYRYEGSGWVNDPVNSWDTGAWDRMAMYQYTSTGQIAGYGGNLDLSVFYGDVSDWNALTGGYATGGTPRVERFCSAMRWAADSDQVGYSQSDRDSLTAADFFTDGLFNSDCSKLTIVAAEYAGYDVHGATYTGNMAEAFERAGFTRVPNDGNPGKGYVLLNEGNHVAVWLGDCLAQASIDENGNIAGGARGDQTGWEVQCRSYYDYPWDFYLAPPADRTIRKGRKKMECLIRPDGKDFMVYFDGSIAHPLEHPDEMKAIEMCYAKCNNGAQIPVFEMGDPENPWATRLFEGASRTFDK